MLTAMLLPEQIGRNGAVRVYFCSEPLLFMPRSTVSLRHAKSSHVLLCRQFCHFPSLTAAQPDAHMDHDTSQGTWSKQHLHSVSRTSQQGQKCKSMFEC